MIATLFEKNTGKISGVMDSSLDVIELTANTINQSFIEGSSNHKLDYVIDGCITPRPESPSYLDGMSIKNLPNPCVILIEGESYDCNETEVELSFSQPGIYKVLVLAWPFLDKEFIVENPA